ncbi:diaminopimelate epimerase [Sphingomonas sp. BGYR3]|uniref:diaminopimelate epimerase n=1 Tax=Sphingomonas sp. BGYR3 TaxID=2975483 RepID=UPI0021A8FBDC|nr:diaminopimelate epimerase [Sphingomonas sp. BGYR3]MDG5489111.1 diaminopimelate epimerase [Sphingomonas sp. BGYR3]
MRIAFIKCQGSGNDFPLVDGRALALDDGEWAAIARALADRAGPVGGDGLLILTGPAGGQPFGMRMLNPDGSEAETCLNGLRCTARLGFEVTGLTAAEVRLKTSVAGAASEPDMAAGVATVRTEAVPAGVGAAAIGLKVAMDGPVDQPVPGVPSARAFTAVAMPNPHLVAFVDAIDGDELIALGDWAEAAPDILPARCNVSFVRVDGADAIYVRTYERGVGLTDSCGSAMAASVLAAVLTGRVAAGAWIRVANRGGFVRAMTDRAAADATITIAGNATFEWEGVAEIDLTTARVTAMTRTAERPQEADAWDAVLAGLD